MTSPAFTQPIMYQKIASRTRRSARSGRGRWSNAALIAETAADELYTRDMAQLQEAFDTLQPEQDFVEPQPEPPPPGAASKVDTAVSLETLSSLNASLLAFPSAFAIHRKLERAREKRGADPGAAG